MEAARASTGRQAGTRDEDDGVASLFDENRNLDDEEEYIPVAKRRALEAANRSSRLGRATVPNPDLEKKMVSTSNVVRHLK